MSYQLISTPAQASADIQRTAARRYISGANQGQERTMYRAALNMSLKGSRPAGSRAVVVSRFNEDTSWTGELQNVALTVYDKGEGNGPNKLANIGREAHTYFTHIVNNYDNLADVTFFLQGWPFDRSSNIIEALNNLSHFDFIEFGSDILETGPLDKMMARFYDHIFEAVCPATPWEFRANSQFGVSKRRIRARSAAFYRRCMVACEVGIPGLPGIEPASMPYLFEQVWKRIFGDRGDD